jgi:transcription elongation factor S-II
LFELSKNDFQTSPQAFENLCVSCATDIEAAVQNLHPHDPRAYREKALSLCFNLKKNAALRSDLLFGSVTADELVALSSHALATAETRAARQERVARLQDSRLLDWEQRHEGKINEICGIKDDLLQASLFTCGRCKSIKTTSTQKQTRSADEPMTVFVLCLNCGNRWKC